MGPAPQTELKEINIWKTEPSNCDYLEDENEVITFLNNGDHKIKFPSSNLIGEIQSKDGKRKVYEAKFFGRLATDVVAAAAQHEVPDLLKRMGRDLVKKLYLCNYYHFTS